MERLQAKADSGEVFDAADQTGWCSSVTVCETVLASEAPGLELEKNALVHTMQRASSLMFYRITRPWFSSDLLFSFSAAYQDYQAVVSGVSAFAAKVLQRKVDKVS